MSRLARTVVFAAALLALGSQAQTGDDVAARELRRIEDELSEALVERDAETLDRLWHTDLIFIRLNGQQSNKEERLAGLATAGPRRDGETNQNDAVDVRIDGDTAVVTVVSTWTTPRDASVSVGRYRALHVWTREAGRWQLLAAQVALIAD